MGVDMGLLLPAVQCGCEDCGGCDKEEVEFDFGAKSQTDDPSGTPKFITSGEPAADEPAEEQRIDTDLDDFYSQSHYASDDAYF